MFEASIVVRRIQCNMAYLNFKDWSFFGDTLYRKVSNYPQKGCPLKSSNACSNLNAFPNEPRMRRTL